MAILRDTKNDALDITAFPDDVASYYLLGERILAKIAANIASDGYLFLGAGETTLNLDTTFRRIEIDRAGVFQVSRGAPDLRPVEAAAAIGTVAAAPRVDWPALGSTPTRPLPTAGVTGTIRPVPRGVT